MERQEQQEQLEYQESEQTPEPKRKRRWRRPGKIGSILLIILAVLLAVTLIANRDRLTIGHLSRAIQYSRLGGPSLAEEFRFASLGSNTFDLLGDGLAVASGGGLRVYDRAANLVYAEAFTMDRPMIQTSGNYVLTYDLGGTEIQTGNRREALAQPDWDRPIDRLIDARINQNGWFVASAEQIGTRGAATVFRPDGTPYFRVPSGTGYLIAAELAADNQTLVLLSVTDAGGRAFWYEVGTAGDPLREYLGEGELFFDFWFTAANGAIGLISSNTVQFISPDGALQSEYRFPDRHLRAYDVSEGNTVLYLAPSPTGPGGELVILEPNGRVQYIEITGNLLDVSLNGRYTAALFFDELLIFRGTSRYARFSQTEGMQHVLMRQDGTVFRLSSHRAWLLVP